MGFSHSSIFNRCTFTQLWTMNSVLLSALLVVLVTVVRSEKQINARVNFQGMGELNLFKVPGGVQIIGELSNLDPGLHGFHVHQYGDIYTNGCLSTGGHFNPENVNHGAPTDLVRHVGDLGNILADSAGNAHFEMFDPLIALDGQYSILGRAFVIHSGEDDLGRGGDEGSLKTGNAGSRIACGIVTLVE